MFVAVLGCVTCSEHWSFDGASKSFLKHMHGHCKGTQMVLSPFGCSVVCTGVVVFHHIGAVFCKSLVSWAHAVARRTFRMHRNELTEEEALCSMGELVQLL